MQSEEIERLLHQASFPNCSRDELNEILDKFLAEIPVDASRQTSKGHLKRELLSELFWEIIKQDPRLLPTQTPVFTILCRKVEIAKNRSDRNKRQRGDRHAG